MESSILLFCIGLAASLVVIARVQGYGIFVRRGPLFASIAVLIILMYLVVHGYYSDVGSSPYRTYVILTSSYVSEIALGALLGPVLFLWFRFYLRQTPTAAQKRSQLVLTIMLCGILVFALLLPYLNRWLTNATSLEISQIAKITIDARQNSATQAPSFVAGATSVSASADFKGEDVLNGLKNLLEMSNADAAEDALDSDEESSEDMPELGRTTGRGMLSHASVAPREGMLGRDRVYSTLTKEYKKEDPREKDIQDAFDNDQAFLRLLNPIARCLRAYAKEYHDYRLFLIDIKPLIVMVTTFARADRLDEADHEAQKLVRLLGASKGEKESPNEMVTFRDQLEKLRTYALDNLLYRKRVRKNACEKTSTPPKVVEVVFRPEKGNALPYKTIALAYLLSAIGSADTAVVELNDWIKHYADRGLPTFYVLRARIELNLLLEKVLPGGYRNPIYRDFVKELVKDFGSILQTTDLLAWSKQCKDIRDKKDPLQIQNTQAEHRLIHVYMTELNYLVKASSNLDDIDSEIVRYAYVNSQVDLSCFDDVDYVVGDKDAWKGEFLTTYGIALLVSSYDERLYGRTDHPDQLRSRELARKSLFDAVNLLDPVIKKKQGKIAQSSDARQIFATPQWEATRNSARMALRSVPTQK
jgi:hypothetical protein